MDWYAYSGDGEYLSVSAEGEEGALEYVQGGDWDREKSCAVTVGVARLRQGDDPAMTEECPQCEAPPGESCGCTVEDTVEEHVIVLHPDEPPCDASQDGGHDWRNPHEFVGGIEDNPGVWGMGGVAISTRHVCVLCGMGRDETSASQGPDTEHDHCSVVYTEEVVDLDGLVSWWQEQGDAPPNLSPSSWLAEELAEE